MNSKSIALVLVGVALTVGATSCGGDDSESSDTTTEAATTAEGGGGEASGTLEGVTGPGFTIELSKDGADVESLPAGTYTLKVDDKSSAHNFHLIGPGVDEAVTDVPFEGEKSVTVTLQKGTYTYQCDPHAAKGMKGSVTVT
jgi:plastocyanin